MWSLRAAGRRLWGMRGGLNSLLRTPVGTGAITGGAIGLGYGLLGNGGALSSALSGMGTGALIGGTRGRTRLGASIGAGLGVLGGAPFSTSALGAGLAAGWGRYGQPAMKALAMAPNVSTRSPYLAAGQMTYRRMARDAAAAATFLGKTGPRTAVGFIKGLGR